VIGATFDADGWAPQGEAAPPSTVATLVAIIRDRDARFEKVKELAVAALAKQQGPEVTTEMLAVLADKRASLKLKETVVEALERRKDPEALPILTAQLAVHDDYIAKTETDAIGPVVRAIAGLRGTKLEPAKVEAAMTALASHLDDPATETTDLIALIGALSAIGGGAERPILASHLLLYHADDDVGANAGWAMAIVGALLANAGPQERAVLHHVAVDPRTKPSLASAITETLAKQ